MSADIQERGHALHTYLYARFDQMIAGMLLQLADSFYVPPRTAVLWGRRAHDMQVGSSQYRHYHERLRGKATTRSRALALAIASVRDLTVRHREQLFNDQRTYGFSVVEHKTGQRVDPREVTPSW